MKFFVSFFLILFYGNCQVQERKKILFIFLQQEVLRPVANDNTTFWESKKDFDTVSIDGAGIINRIENNLKMLKVEDIGGISILCALISYKNKVAVDTIYADQFLEYWQIGKFIYKDTSGYFEKNFGHFFNINN